VVLVVLAYKVSVEIVVGIMVAVDMIFVVIRVVLQLVCFPLIYVVRLYILAAVIIPIVVINPPEVMVTDAEPKLGVVILPLMAPVADLLGFVLPHNKISLNHPDEKINYCHL
jgi:hypothetical protein